MRHTGFILVGGASSRMGTDKALLPCKGMPLAQYMARLVAQAAGGVALIGDPLRYAALEIPVFPDRFPGSGPLGGIATALAASQTEWALIVGCDMPALTADLLRSVLRETEMTSALCIVPAGPTGPEPLAAAYHRACLPQIEKAISEKRLKLRDAVLELNPKLLPGFDPACFGNLNTPEDFLAFSHR